MAGIGSLGGLGGFGVSYPMRMGTPSSQKVMSNEEWEGDWRTRLGALDPTVPGAQLVPGAEGYQSAAADPYYSQIIDLQNQFNPYQNLVEADPDRFKQIAFEQSAYANGASGNAGHTVGQVNNPVIGEMQQQYEREKEQRGTNQVRQQQAYDSMRGWGQENGVIGANYSQPGFGQINGIAGNPYAPDADATAGVDMSWTDGAFNPQAGNAGVYSPGARKSGGWGLW